MGKYQQHTVSKRELENVTLSNCSEMCKNSSVSHQLSKLIFADPLVIYGLLHKPLLSKPLKSLKYCFPKWPTSLSLLKQNLLVQRSEYNS